MPLFSAKSKENLQSCDQELQDLFNEVIKRYDCTVICGFRIEEAQTEAFRTGVSKVNWPNSNHNIYPSNAVDVAPCPIDWGNRKRFYMFIGYVLATADQMGIKIRSGGDWDGDKDITDQTFFDLPHFELIK